MNYTENYHLPQWVKSDRIMMDDFNQMNQDIDACLTSAVATADDARTDAAQAKQTANAAQADVRGWKNYVVGNYTGAIAAPVTVELGFRPSALLIWGYHVLGGTSGGDGPYSIFTDGSIFQDKVTITDTGFTVGAESSYSHYPLVNNGNREYAYIAFR